MLPHLHAAGPAPSSSSGQGSRGRLPAIADSRLPDDRGCSSIYPSLNRHDQVPHIEQGVLKYNLDNGSRPSPSSPRSVVVEIAQRDERVSAAGNCPISSTPSVYRGNLNDILVPVHKPSRAERQDSVWISAVCSCPDHTLEPISG